MGVAFSPDCRLLAAATWDGQVRMWDLAAGQERPPLKGHTSAVMAVAFFQRVARGEDEDRHVVVGAQRARHLQAVDTRKPEIKDDQVGRKRSPLLERGSPVGSRAHLVALHPQGALQRLGDVLVVLHHEDTWSACDVVLSRSGVAVRT